MVPAVVRSPCYVKQFPVFVDRNALVSIPNTGRGQAGRPTVGVATFFWMFGRPIGAFAANSWFRDGTKVDIGTCIHIGLLLVLQQAI